LAESRDEFIQGALETELFYLKNVGPFGAARVNKILYAQAMRGSRTQRFDLTFF
jgi:hypothetical protein